MSFFDRLKLALAILFGRRPDDSARLALGLLAPSSPPPPGQEPVHPERSRGTLTLEQRHGAALFLLGLFQREGRLLDFLKEDIATFTDAEVGGAARLVHSGCARVLGQYLPIAPVVTQAEGASMEIAPGFDANRFRLTGNVTGTGPWKGSLKHHGWVAATISLPDVPTTVDVKVIAPAEVELP